MMMIFQKLGKERPWGKQGECLPYPEEAPTENVIPTGQFQTVQIIDGYNVECSGAADILYEGAVMEPSGLKVFNYPEKLGSAREQRTTFKQLDVAKIWNTQSRGVRRGWPHHTTSRYSGPTPGTSNYRNPWPVALEKIKDAAPKLYKFIKWIEMDQVIEHAHITFTDVVVEAIKDENGEWVITFVEHVDKHYTGKKAFRGMLTCGRHPQWRDGKKKILRIIDREYGRWVDILCDHGTYIQMSKLYAGLTGRYTHIVFNGQGTACLIMDYD